LRDYLVLGESEDGLEDGLEGFQKKFVTPYMHCMVYHVPEQIKKHGSLMKFFGQRISTCNILSSCFTHMYIYLSNEGVEKNDNAKHNFFSSNRHDPHGEVLRTEKRLEQLDSDCRREKRPYTKHNQQYWTETIKTQRAAKRARTLTNSTS